MGIVATGCHLYHHARVAPLGIATGGTHAIDHQEVATCGGRDDESAGTHTEGVDSSSLCLCGEGIFGCRQVVAASVGGVVLYLVDECARMFETHPHGERLTL